MAESVICKTAIITPFGLWEFFHMPFGLKNAAQTFQTFQRLMGTILRGISCISIYLDDIVVSSSTRTEHADHLRQVFNALSLIGMVVQRQKYVFGVAEIDCLGHHGTTSDIKPLPEHVSAVVNSPFQIQKKVSRYSLEWLTFTTDSSRNWLATYILYMGLAKEEVKQLPGQMIAKLPLTLPSQPLLLQPFLDTPPMDANSLLHWMLQILLLAVP